MKMDVKDRMRLPEYQEYLLILLEYKQSQSKHTLFLNSSGHLETSSNPLDRAKFYDERARNSKMCKRFYAAKKRYIQAVALASLEEVDLDATDTVPSPEILAQLRGIAPTPVSMVDIIAAEKESRRQQEAQKIAGQDPTMRKMTREFCAMGNTPIPEWLHEYDEEDGITTADDIESAEEVDSDTSSDDAITFDEEFDKL
jgi:hypothetical protein